MKIKKFKKLSNVGILDEESYINNFNLTKEEKKGEELKTINTSKVLCRGDNGTGKSTISNIFRSIEKNEEENNIINKIKSIDNENNIEIEIELEDDTVIKYNNKSKKWENTDNVYVKVFSEDYIKENINLEDFCANKFDCKYETQEVEVSSEKKEYEKCKKEFEEIKQKGDEIKKAIVDKIQITNEEIKKSADVYCILKDEAGEYIEKNDINEEVEEKINKFLEAYRQLKKSESFRPLIINNIIYDIDENKFRNLLEYEADVSKIEFMNELLALSSQKREWIDKGLEYIEDEKCPFCKECITNNKTIKNYKNYKESRTKEIEKELLEFQESFEKYKEKINIIKNSLMENNKYSTIASSNIEISEDEWKAYSTSIDNMISIVKNKLNNVNIKMPDIAIDEYTKNIKNVFIKSNIIDENITKINKIMLSSKNELTKIRSELKKLYKERFEFYQRENLKKRRELMKQYEEKNIELKVKKEKYEEKLLHSNETIKEMNKWITFFGLTKYKIDPEFNLIYKSKKISDKLFILSTGEISAIVFAYYMATLIVGISNEDKKKLVIIIDDPVNSVDYNKIFSFSTAIKMLQNRIDSHNNPQIIILTHNMLFYNILIQTNFMKNSNAKAYKLYLHDEKAEIEESRNYKDSLFVVQLAQIIQCANEDVGKINIEKAYIYNDIRSVIENLCYLLDPKYVDKEKVNVLQPFFGITNEENSKLDFIINNNSHNEPMLNIEKWFDPELLHECCMIISNMINAKFSELHNYCLNLKE
jgi:wobble nucleotide-excising tRNase